MGRRYQSKKMARTTFPLQDEIRGIAKSNGSLCLKSQEIPLEETWIITRIAARYEGKSSPSCLSVKRINKQSIWRIYSISFPSANYWYHHSCKIILKRGDYLELCICDLALGSEAILWYQGFAVENKKKSILFQEEDGEEIPLIRPMQKKKVKMKKEDKARMELSLWKIRHALEIAGGDLSRLAPECLEDLEAEIKYLEEKLSGSKDWKYPLGGWGL